MSKISLTKLNFNLPEINTEKLQRIIKKNTDSVLKIGQTAGQNNAKFDRAIKQLKAISQQGKAIEPFLREPIDVRAYAVSISEDQFTGRFKNKYINNSVLTSLSDIRSRPSGLLVESLTKQYFKLYDEVDCYRSFAKWLINAKDKRKELDENTRFLLGEDGPKSVADRCIEQQVDFVTVVQSLGLNKYGAGRYYTVAQLCYYINRLEKLKANESSDLLTELMHPTAYNAPFTEYQLLGHRALEILIDKAPEGTELNPQWEKFILSVAGDPRIPKDHDNYRKWWSYLGNKRIEKVRSWLSRLDLKIFLEVLEQYAKSRGGADIQRMYPPRKIFLEGLFNAKLVKSTRLYLSSQADAYAKRHYDRDELPSYSLVTGNQASIIALQIGDRYLVEGSHSCKIWLYKNLSPKAIIHDYRITTPSYSNLTQGMDSRNQEDGGAPAKAIVHNRSHWNWQHHAIEQLQEWNVNVSPKDVIDPLELKDYLRYYGY